MKNKGLKIFIIVSLLVMMFTCGALFCLFNRTTSVVTGLIDSNTNTNASDIVPETKVVLEISDNSKTFKVIGIPQKAIEKERDREKNPNDTDVSDMGGNPAVSGIIDYSSETGWHSSDPTVASVNDEGTVTPYRPGVTIITYKVVGYDELSTEIIVVGEESETVTISTRSGDGVSSVIKVGESVDYHFTGCAEWRNATERRVYYDSSDDNILCCINATTGEFKAISPGIVTVKVAIFCDGKVCHTGFYVVTVEE